jgi:serine/threonine protein kinase
MAGEGRKSTLDAAREHADAVLPEVAGFEVLERIGRGGMGEVYAARQTALGRLVAIKFLAPEGERETEDDLARFRREAKLMAQVSHPNILSIFDFGEVDGRSYLVMEYIEGGDLRGRLKPGQPMAIEDVRSIVVPVGEALSYLHRNGIIHRDLKPENILLHEGENPRVSDFGIAVLRAGASPGASTRTRGGLGTLGYTAPEQQYGLKIDERVDQFSLAAVAYEMLTGHLPLGIFKPPSALNPKVGPRTDATILRALQENPKERFATIRDFTAALSETLGGSPAGSRPRAPELLAIAGGLALVALVGALVLRPNWTQGPNARDARTPPAQQPSRDASAVGSPADGATDPTGNAEPLLEELKQLRAHQIWKARGSPEGAVGAAVKDAIWFDAERAVTEDVQLRAYRIWEAQGRPVGAAGKALEKKNWADALRQIYKETTGKDPPPPALEAQPETKK